MIANLQETRLKQRSVEQGNGEISAAELLFGPAVLASAENGHTYSKEGQSVEVKSPQNFVRFEQEKIIVSKEVQSKCYIVVREPAGKVTPTIDAEGNLEVYGDATRILVGIERSGDKGESEVVWVVASTPDNKVVSKEYITRYLTTAKKNFEISFASESNSIATRKLSTPEATQLSVNSLYFKRIQSNEIAEAKKIEEKIVKIAVRSEELRQMGELLHTVSEVKERKNPTLALKRMFTLPGFSENVYYILKVQGQNYPVTLGKETTLYADRLELTGELSKQIEVVIAVQPGNEKLSPVSVAIPNPLSPDEVTVEENKGEYSWFKVNVPRIIKAGMQMIEETTPHLAEVYPSVEEQKVVQEIGQEKLLSKHMHISRGLIGVQPSAMGAFGYKQPMEVWINGEKVMQVGDTSISSQKKGFVYFFLPKNIESIKLVQPGTEVLPALEEKIDTSLVTYDTPKRKLERMVSSDGNRITFWKEPVLEGYQKEVFFLVRAKKGAKLKMEENLHTILPTISIDADSVYSVEVFQTFESDKKREITSLITYQEKLAGEEVDLYSISFQK